MPPKNQPVDPERRARIIAAARQSQSQREGGYREQALRLFPHVCGRCGREFAGKTLRELTVHHRDHDHMNNPPDGSNWELLCLYCHDAEHQTPEQRAQHGTSQLSIKEDTALGFNAFAGLKNLLPPAPEDNTKDQAK